MSGNGLFWQGRHHRPDSIEKIRAARLGKSSWNKGKTLPPFSDEHRAKLSAALKGKPHTAEHTARAAASYRGYRHTEETKAKISAINKGRKHTEEWKKANSERMRAFWQDLSYRERQLPNIRSAAKGCVRSDEYKKKLSEARKGKSMLEETRRAISATLKGRVFSPEHRSKIVRSTCQRPTKPEWQLLEMLDRLFPNEYRYVGDGSLIIGGKCPDFANVNGQKKLIEMFGNYWHQKGVGEESLRIELFSTFGYKTLVVWEDELQDITVLNAILEKFHGS